MEQEKGLMRYEPTGLTAISVHDLAGQVKQVQEIMVNVMKDKEHYGKIPGCGDKVSLFKSGAEKLCFAFRMAPKYVVTERQLASNHREYSIVCDLYQIGSNTYLGQGMGLCSTMETKYRYRSGTGESTGRQVPKGYWDLRKSEKKEDQAAAQELLGGKGFAAKKVESGAWEIFTKSDKAENPDIADTYNTVMKMAKKRAMVDAVLSVTAASDIFTQDVEDMEGVILEYTPKSEPATASSPADAPAFIPASNGGITAAQIGTLKKAAALPGFATIKETLVGMIKSLTSKDAGTLIASLRSETAKDSPKAKLRGMVNRMGDGYSVDELKFAALSNEEAQGWIENFDPMDCPFITLNERGE